MILFSTFRRRRRSADSPRLELLLNITPPPPLLLFLGFLVSIIASMAFANTTTTTSDSTSTYSMSAVSKANTLFATDFYSVLKSSAPNTNLIFSPFSLSAAIGMLKVGAAGITGKEISRGMHYPPDQLLYDGFEAQLAGLKSNENFTLETANSIYTSIGFDLNPTFESIIKSSFGAKIQQLDFTNPALSASIINEFVESVTHDKINNLISPSELDPNTRLILVNAIYFKGLWKNRFDERLTRKEIFYVAPESQVLVEMMKLTAEFEFGDVDELDCKVISLPYKGDRLSMMILLPNKLDGLAELETKLKSYDLSVIGSKLLKRRVSLSMPKFKLESEIDLKGPLQALGMKSMFDEATADLSGIPDPLSARSRSPLAESLYVSKAVQKAFLEVNEEGSEAAGATTVGVKSRSGLRHRLRIMTLDHPFIAFIQDSPSYHHTHTHHHQHQHHNHHQHSHSHSHHHHTHTTHVQQQPIESTTSDIDTTTTTIPTPIESSSDQNILFMSSLTNPIWTHLITFNNLTFESIGYKTIQEEEAEERRVAEELEKQRRKEQQEQEEADAAKRRKEEEELAKANGDGEESSASSNGGIPTIASTTSTTTAVTTTTNTPGPGTTTTTTTTTVLYSNIKHFTTSSSVVLHMIKFIISARMPAITFSVLHFIHSIQL